MLSDILLPGEYFVTSDCLYCLVTNASGKVLFANSLAQAHLHIGTGFHMTMPELPLNGCIHMANDTHMVNEEEVPVQWEVIPVETDTQSKRYKWVAPALQLPAAMAAFRASEKDMLYQDIMDQVPAIIWMTDAESHLVYVNQRWIAFTGVTVNEMTAGWQFMVHEDDREAVRQTFLNACQYKLPVTLNYRLRKKGGAYCWVQNQCTPRFEARNRFAGYIGSLIDINEQKLKEQQLQHQLTLLENISDSIVITDLNGCMISANKIAEAFYHLEGVAYIGRPLKDMIPLKANLLEEAVLQLAKKKSCRIETSFTNSMGQAKHVLQTIKYVHDSDGRQKGLMIVGRDITERKNAEEQLQKSEQFYRSLIADSLDGILLTDASGTITFASPSIKEILGYETDEILGFNAFSYVHPDDHGWALQAFQREVDRSAEVRFIVIRLLKKSGDWLWCMVRGNNLLDHPNVSSIVIYLHDDTPRKQANDALKESEKRFRSLIRDLQLGVILLDSEGRIVIYNKAIAQMLDIEEEKLVGHKMSEIVMKAAQENGVPYANEDMPLFRVRKNKQPVNNLVMGLDKGSSKERVWLLVNMEPVLDEQEQITHIICSVNDITERKKLEQKLLAEKINQQKLLTQATIDGQEKERKEIGKELHDNIGQQLTTTKLFLDLAKTTADDNTNEMISLALKGISDVINEIRHMSRSLVPPSLGDLGLIDSINDLVDSLSRTQYLKIDFDYYNFNEDFISDNKKLMLFRIIQEQLNNIVKHAEAGKVTIRLSDKETYLLLEVIDDGKGFEMAKVRKGLGLTNIKNRAELFGGTMHIVSAQGQGCTLQVLVPYVCEETTA